MAWRVADLGDVFTAAKIENPPEGLPRHTDDQMIRHHRPQGGQPQLGIFEMLKDLATHEQIRPILGGIEVIDAALTKQLDRSTIGHGIDLGQINHGLGKITTTGVIALAMPTKGPISFAAAHLMNGLGSRLGHQGVKTAVKPTHEAADQGITARVFVEGVPHNNASLLLTFG
jgi:hypothetical protein